MSLQISFLSGDFLTFITSIVILDLLPVFDLEEELDQGYRIRTLPWRYRRGARVLLVGETGEKDTTRPEL